MNKVIIMIALVFILFFAGLGAGYGISSLSSGTRTAVSTPTAQENQTSPYVVTLVLTTNNLYNSTIGDQPAYYVLGPNGLQSSANLSLPAHRLIKLVIINYDDGNATLSSSQYANVSGTMDNSISYVNNAVVNSSEGANGIVINGVQNVSSVPQSEIAHTFTIPSLNINIPVPVVSTVTAYFTISAAGTYTWLCMTECGSGTNGSGGAMSTPGWMTGSVMAR